MLQILKNLFLDNYKHNKKYFWYYVLITFFVTWFALSLPVLSGRVIDYIGLKDIGSDFLILLGIFAFLVIIEQIVDRCSWICLGYIKAKNEIRLTHLYYQKFLGLDYHHIIEHGTGKLIKKISNGINAELRIFEMTMRALSIVGMRGLTIVVIFFFVFPAINIVIAFLIVLVLVMDYVFEKKLKPMNIESKDISEIVGNTTTKMVLEFLNLKIFNKVEYELKNLHRAWKQYPILDAKISWLNDVPYDIMALFIRLGEILIYLFVGYQVVQWTQTMGTMIMLTTYLWRLWFPISVLMENFAVARKELVRYEELQIFLQTPLEIMDGDNAYIYHKGHIVLQDIAFDYGKTSLFKEFNMSFESWKVTALVGHSGSGKSTLMKLLLRLYDVKSWNILIDWQALRSLKMSSWYDHIGYLSQEPAIFEWTIKDNLMYAFSDDILKNLSSKQLEDTMWEALKKAHAFELVDKMEKKLDTYVGEKWVKLSGGEKQRIAIARVFLKNPNIVLLDEPTSALDSVSEHHITQSLKELMKGRTVIIIAHRLQTVMHADKIVVLEKWRIIQQGNHNELIIQEWVYKTLVNLQNGLIEE